MKVTVWVPKAEVLATLDLYATRDREDLESMNAELKKLEDSIIHDPYKESKVLIIKGTIKKIEDNLIVMDRQRAYVNSHEDDTVQVEFEQ